MPIKHLQSNRAAAFPCIGKLRKGGEKQTNQKGKEVMGRDLDHFRFVTDDPDAAKAFAAYYGNEPRSVNVFLPYATADENFQAWMEEYRAGGLVRRCDGETCVFQRDAQGRAITAPTPCARQCACKQVGRLAVIVPELQRMAYVTVETHSVYDIVQITENLHAAQALRGDLRGIPFILSRREREISTPTGDGGRARRKKWLLFIEPDPQWVSRQLESMRIAAMPVIGGELPSLPSPAPRLLVDHGTGEIIADADWQDDDAEPSDHQPAAPQTVASQTVASQTVAQPATQNPTPPAQHTNGIATADAATIARLTEIAIAVYGDRWNADKERKVAEGASKGAVTTLSDLTPREAEDLSKILVGRFAAMSSQPAATQESI